MYIRQLKHQTLQGKLKRPRLFCQSHLGVWQILHIELAFTTGLRSIWVGFLTLRPAQSLTPADKRNSGEDETCFQILKKSWTLEILDLEPETLRQRSGSAEKVRDSFSNLSTRHMVLFIRPDWVERFRPVVLIFAPGRELHWCFSLQCLLGVLSAPVLHCLKWTFLVARLLLYTVALTFVLEAFVEILRVQIFFQRFSSTVGQAQFKSSFGRFLWIVQNETRLCSFFCIVETKIGLGVLFELCGAGLEMNKKYKNIRDTVWAGMYAKTRDLNAHLSRMHCAWVDTFQQCNSETSVTSNVQLGRDYQTWLRVRPPVGHISLYRFNRYTVKEFQPFPPLLFLFDTFSIGGVYLLDNLTVLSEIIWFLNIFSRRFTQQTV